MGLKKAFTRHISHRRRSLVKSCMVALVFFILFSSVTLSLIYHQRAQFHHDLAQRTQRFAVNYLNTLTGVMRNILPLTQESCRSAQPNIGYRAAFTPDVRTFLLIKNGVAYCSSATGDMRLGLKAISPEINWHQPLDMKLQSGTPMIPYRSAVMVWLRTPGSNADGVLATLDIHMLPYLLSTPGTKNSGVAVIMGTQALTTFSADLIPLDRLPPYQADRLSIPGYPLALLFYNQKLTGNDIRLTLLAGLVLSLLIGVLCYYAMLLRQSPERALIRGMKRNEFFMEYQPVFHTASNAVSGLEALLRWQHPTEGRIPPDLFIPYAESENLIVPLTRHLFKLIADDAAKLAQALPPGAKLGMNIAPSHLRAPSFHQDVLELLTQLPQHDLTLVFEITERDMVEEDCAQQEFDWLHHQGIEIAIDDFGTGHSALIYLQRFSMDYLKIDRGFVNTIGRDTVTAPVLDAVLTLADKLKMRTVAEGVETTEQVNFLQQRGVSFMQGYYFSKPLKIDDFVDFCQANSVYNCLTGETTGP
ncbi:cyclic di-GMP phosphodiesterase [Serratia rhizosphaerae]|uniref:cyclic di-GMP phosphodiesterase n=1 Tax=Serratia rhizosphaerae TaxID=2597702 RepID=UPI002DB63926|nr:cyclic di-GMP phosphodiesterase [Serratia rhizosphaerae]MEB6335351.1 cyclic di-GMP phosphodiesterase [Serratia rhizosphaerae]